MKRVDFLCVVFMILFCCWLSIEFQKFNKEQTIVVKKTYNDGVNDALERIALLDLELKINGDKKTWGEMSNIVRKRLGVKKEKVR